MGKKGKKKSRAPQKEKLVSTHSPRSVIQQSNPSSETTDDGLVTQKERNSCSHYQKDHDLAKILSKIESSELIRCEDCREAIADRRANSGKGKKGKKKGNYDSKSKSRAVWICLECGHFSCGGVGLALDYQTHAYRHSKKDGHPLAIQYENPKLRFCFPCKTLIPVEKTEDGESKDIFSTIVKSMREKSLEKPSADVEDVWFGGASLKGETKSANGLIRSGHVIRGLVNLGNTCFFNSIMQNLLAIDRLRDYFLNLDGGSFGPLTMALKKLYMEAYTESEIRSSINPRSLFGSLCSKAPQFRGYEQHDSHELLHVLLDGLCTEEISARKQITSVSQIEISVNKSITFVDSIFGGQLSSTVCCLECGHSSIVYEPFLDISLPVPTKKSPSRKTPSVPRARKLKPPPKKFGKIRSKVKKAAESNQSTTVNSSSHVPLSGDSNQSSDLNSASAELESEQVLQNFMEKPAEISDDFTWLDYLEPTSNDLFYMNSKENEFSFIQGSESKEITQNDVFFQNSVITPNLKSESCVNSWEDEVPPQVQSSQVLLLPYKEDSSSVVEEDSSNFDGFGDLFNEPEIQIGPTMKESEIAKTGFVGGDSSDSDPDEVDNTDSPVSIESCFTYFTKPELLSNEHAWHCEKCSKKLQEGKGKTRKRNLTNGKSNSTENLVSNHGKIDNPKHTRENGKFKNELLEAWNSSGCYETYSEASLSKQDADCCSVNDQDHRRDAETNSDPKENEEEMDSSETVKVKRDATKRILISRAPPILTIHLKRFGQDSRGRLSKLNGYINFKETIDLCPYIEPRSVEGEERYEYRLVGVVEHSGTMRGGHYVAYVRGGDKRSKGDDDDNSSGRGFVWYHASDVYVREVSLNQVLACEAYILFYEKV